MTSTTGELKYARGYFWIAAATVLVSVLSLGTTAVVSVVTASATNESAHKEAAIARRSEAYASYVGQLAKLNEFLWSNLSWAGEGALAPQPSDLTGFWATASQLQSDLQTDYLVATMLTSDSDMQADLSNLQSSQQTMFREFKCMSEIQPDDCAGVPAGTHSDIQRLVLDWSGSREATVTSFIDQARTGVI